MSKTDIILEEMDKYGADGVDFIPIDQMNLIGPKVYCSYTRDEWIASDRSYPRTCRRYWKMLQGRKVVVSPDGTTPKPTDAPTVNGDCFDKKTAEKIFADIFAKVGFDGHNVSIYKNELIEIAKNYGIEAE